MQKYEAVIGLEVHVQLQTDSKIFSPSSVRFGAEPNTLVDPICLGMPGVLPVLNKKVVEYAVRMGLATSCTIAERSIFARKHYFYPDLPKGYQISQFEQPLCENGTVDVEVDDKRHLQVHIIRIHLEEDAGKSVHNEQYVDSNQTLIDLNRCGVPLIEIVTGPDFRRPDEAAAYLEHIRQLVRYLEISDGNMEEGSLRCDANVSVREAGSQTLGTKTELKNMNTISGVEKALEFEIARQIEVLQNGGTIEQQTLLWDPENNRTVLMRSKEQSHDYRYLPDPDLAPLVLEPEWLAHIRDELPELPSRRRARFVEQYRLPKYDAALLCAEKALADYFEAVVVQVESAKTASNWIMGNIMRILNEQKIDISACPIQPDRLASLIKLLEKNEISGNSAKLVFDEMVNSPELPDAIVDAKGWRQLSDENKLEQMVDALLARHPEEVQRFQDGEQKLIGFFVGQLMRETKGTANPAMLNKLLQAKLQAGMGKQ